MSSVQGSSEQDASKGRKQPESSVLPAGNSEVCERREALRYSAHFTASIRAAARNGHEHMAITQSISSAGALLLTRGRFGVGEQVEVGLFIGDDDSTVRTVRARVVRSLPLADARAGLWKSETAVEFDESQSDLEACFRAKAGAQVKMPQFEGSRELAKLLGRTAPPQSYEPDCERD
jgi:hypothetical protein